MKTSPELLTDILGVLGQINSKLDAISGAPKPKGDPTIKLGAVGVIGSLLGKKGAAGQMADDVEKLKKAMSGNFIKNLTNSIDKLREYAHLSKEISTSKRATGWAHAAQDMGKALMVIAGGIGAFVGVLALSGAVLGVKPIGVLGFVIGTMVSLSLSMALISGGEFVGENIGGLFGKKLPGVKADKDRNKRSIQNAKDMGLALMYIAGGIMSFGIVLGLSAAIFGVGKAILVPLAVMAIVGIIGLTIVGLAELTAIGDKRGVGVGKGKSKDAIQNAKDMGIALMFIAGGILSFAITMALVPKLLKKTDIGSSMLQIGLIIAGMVGVFVLLNFIGKFMQGGIRTAQAMSVAIIILSAGVFVVALTSKILLEMFRSSKTVTDEAGKTTKEKTGPGAAIKSAAAGLGIFGIFVAGLGALLWIMGLPIISGPIALGSLALIGMAFGLIMTAKAIKKVTETMDEIGDMKKVSENIRLMVSGVLSGVISGVMGKDEATGLGDIDISLKDVRQFRRVTKIIKLLGKVSTSLTQFAKGLTAFSKVGEIASLDYEFKEDGTVVPKIGEGGKIHVKTIAQSIADTFGLFLRTLVTSTEGMTRREARSLKILGKALTGDKGIISGVSQFANILQTFSKFGSKGEIYVPEMKDDSGKVIREAENVKITTITKNIVDSFGKFVEAIASRAPEFEIGGRVGKKMQKFTEALMGQEKGFGKRAKPGILSGITTFNDTLLVYSEYGAGGKIPKKDKDGNIIPGQFVKVEDVVRNMVDGITTFTSSLERALAGKDIEASAKAIEKKMGSFADIITSFDELAASQEGMDKLASSMGLLATNVGLLVTNMGGLDVGKLQTLATITGQHAVATKGVTIAEKSATTSAAAAAASQPDWDRIGEIIGARVAEKVSLNNSTMDFYFHDWPTGKVEVRTK